MSTMSCLMCLSVKVSYVRLTCGSLASLLCPLEPAWRCAICCHSASCKVASAAASIKRQQTVFGSLPYSQSKLNMLSLLCRRDNPNMKHLMQGAYTWYALPLFCMTVHLLISSMVPVAIPPVDLYKFKDHKHCHDCLLSGKALR